MIFQGSENGERQRQDHQIGHDLVEVIMRQVQAAFVHDTSTRLPSVTTPTLVMHGTADDMLVYSNGELIASLIPDAKLHTFTDVGHLFWWERPEESADAVRRHALG